MLNELTNNPFPPIRKHRERDRISSILVPLQLLPGDCPQFCGFPEPKRGIFESREHLQLPRPWPSPSDQVQPCFQCHRWNYTVDWESFDMSLFLADCKLEKHMKRPLLFC